MIEATLLSEQWAAYERRKVNTLQDSHIFCPDQPWEFTYLSDLLLAAAPHLDPLMVMLSIRHAMRQTYAPRTRDHFVNVVVESIHDRLKNWEQILAREK
jgi:hypothetical protein